MLKGSWIKETCELLGVTVLCFLVISLGTYKGEISAIESSLFGGITVGAIIYGIGTISGAHINPAVSLGFWVTKRFSTSQFYRYLAAQGLGSIVAMLLLLLVVGKDFNWAQAAPQINSPLAFGIEVFLTGFLIFTILSVSTVDCRICPDARPVAGVVVAGTVALLSFYGGQLGVGGLNPAVPLAWAFLSNSWLGFLLYLLATSLGAAIAALLYQWLHAPDGNA